MACCSSSAFIPYLDGDRTHAEVYTKKLIQAELDAMPIKEKLEVSEALRDSFSASDNELPVPDWHEQLLDESIERLKRHPDNGSNWATVKARLRKDR